jgi:hypothetical protein
MMSKNKPSVFSNAFKFILLLAIGILLTFVLLSYGFHKWIIFIIVLLLYVSVSIFWPMYIIYKSKSLGAINRYVASNYKKPIFGYSYALGHGNKRDIEYALKRIMNTYKQQDMYDVYGANLALFQNNPTALSEHAKNISGQEYKDYYAAHVFVMNGNFERAGELLSKLHTPWMIHSLKAYAAHKRGEQATFRQEADRSIKSAIGMQRYVLHHTMRRIENGDFANQ